MDWTLPLDAVDHAFAVKLRQQLGRYCEEIAGKGLDVEVLAAAMATHLAKLKLDDLPPPARVVWQERVTRPLKADARKPLGARALKGIRSWPMGRVEGLHAALLEIAALLVEAENDANNAAIQVEISRAYS